MLLQQSNHVRNFCDGFYLTEKPAAHFYTWRKKNVAQNLGAVFGLVLKSVSGRQF